MRIGDRVTWTHRWTRGRSVNFTTREGIISCFYEDGKVCVKSKGKEYRLRADRLRVAGQTTELTEMVLNV